MLLLSACADKGPAPVTKYGAGAGAGSAGIHTVSKGETVYKISERYRLPMQDIIAVNNLSPPYMLDVGQRLELPPPREYRVRPGDTLYGVARLFNVSSNAVARLNDLRAPYKLSSGQVLRLPSPVTQTVAAAPAPEPARVANPPRAPEKPQQKQARTARKEPVRTSAPPRSSGRFLTPVNGPVISTYGPKADGLHNDGINIKAPRGTPVRAAENGVVVYADSELGGYGNLVLIRHADRWMTAYAHLDKFSVSRGQEVKRGATIGTVGSTGSVETPQLHFEIRRGTEALNPKRYLE